MCPQPDPRPDSTPEGIPHEQVTILIHGTFANPDYSGHGEEAPVDVERESRWWRLTEGNDETVTPARAVSNGHRRRAGDPPPAGEGSTADRLKKALEELGSPLASTIWRPNARDGDLDWRDLCEWTGDNTNGARVRAAKTFAHNLGVLADRRGCTVEHPLFVNFVAHSHGGNVALETVKRLGDNVKARQVCMLGTPLIWRFPDLRILYPVILFFILREVVLQLSGGVEALSVGLTGTAYSLTYPGIGTVGIAVLAFGLLLPVVLWAGVLAITWAREIPGAISRGLAWVGLKSVSELFGGEPAYGPRPTVLERKLDGHPALLVISPQDEADLMLQLGAAPIDAYRAMVAGRPDLEGVRKLMGAGARLVLRYVEFAYVRPLSYVLIVPFLELALERTALGFRDVLFYNYEMVTWMGKRTYEARQISRRKVRAGDLEQRFLTVPLTDGAIGPAVGSGDRPGTEADPVRLRALDRTLRQTFKDLVNQVHLRHSGYYQSQDIIEVVAKAIAGSATPSGTPPSSDEPGPVPVTVGRDRRVSDHAGV